MRPDIRLGRPEDEVIGHMMSPEGVVCPRTSVSGQREISGRPYSPHMPEISGLLALTACAGPRPIPLNLDAPSL